MTKRPAPHTQIHHPTGAPPTDPTTDVIAGDPPVPITVWRTARDRAEPPGTITDRLAYRLVAAYSRPGEAIVDFTDGHALAATAQRGRRRYHLGWLTDTQHVVVSPATHDGDGADQPAGGQPARHEHNRRATSDRSTSGQARSGRAKAPHAKAGELEAGQAEAGGTDVHRAGSGGGDADDLAVWFGDDLTDTDTIIGGGSLPADGPYPAAGPSMPGAGRAGLVAGVDDLTRQATLIVASWPLDRDGEAANRVRLAFLLDACRWLLRPGGCLVLVAGVPAGQPLPPEDFTGVVAAASAAQLGYLQHIVAVAADTDGDQFVYYATDEELLALSRDADADGWYLHVPVHADLLVFVAQAPSLAARPRAGGARG